MPIHAGTVAFFLVPVVWLMGLCWMRRARQTLAPESSTLWRDLVGWFPLGVLVAAVGLVIGTQVIGSGFAVLRIWFDAASFGLAPLLLLMGGLALREKAGFAAFFVLAAGASAFGIAFYATRVEPFRLEVTHHVIHSERLSPGVDASLLIAILADLQTDQIGAFEAEVFRTIDELKPDLILLPGDYLQLLDPDEFDDVQPALIELFRSMDHAPRLGIVAVDGDVDEAARSLRGTGALCLTDQTVQFPEDHLQIIGLSTPASRRDLTPGVLAEIDAFEGLTIVCGHAPDHMNMVLEGRFDKEAVLVAGHTHGGQVSIPGFGPLITLSSIPRWLAAGTLRPWGKTTLLVSRGVGMERGHAPRIRFNCRPQLVVLELVGSAARG